jgi:MYXO-CTERM domain-containing protein
MNRIALSSLVLASAVASGAQAGLVGFTGFEVDSLGNIGGVDVYQVYATFSDPTGFAQLNIYNHSVSSGTMSAIHSDGAGTWNPFATSASNASNDSFVTIDGAYGFSTMTALDPSFGNGFGGSFGNNGGWYTSSPATVISGSRILIMQIALAAGDVGYTATAKVGYKAVGTTTALEGTGTYTVGFVPAPGALALLGLAGVCARRRR